MEIISYLTDLEKSKIKKIYQAYLDREEKVRVMFIAVDLDIPAALVKQYILEQYGEGAKDNIYHSESHYIDINNGYIRYKDFNNLYKHQFVMSRELGTEFENIRKYVVHHKDKDRTNNRFENLHLFYNAEMHSNWHWLESKEPQANIFDFTQDSIEKILEDGTEREMIS